MRKKIIINLMAVAWTICGSLAALLSLVAFLVWLKKKCATSQHINTKKGLPNLGNTCFLNSSLQVLYRALNLKAPLDQCLNSQIKPNYPLKFLKQIFLQLEYCQSNKKKQILLEEFLDYAEDKKINDYKRYAQNDAKMFLFYFLQILIQKSAKVKELVTIQYKLKFQEQKFGNFKVESYVISLSQKDVQDETILLINKPQYIFINNHHSLKMQIQFNVKNGNPITYECISFIQYSGNYHSSGHFVAYSSKTVNTSDKIEKVWQKFNDNQVTEEKIPQNKIRGSLALYEKKYY